MTRPGEARRDRIVDYLRHTPNGPPIKRLQQAVKGRSMSQLQADLVLLRHEGRVDWQERKERTLHLTETRIPGVVDGRPGWWTPEVRA